MFVIFYFSTFLSFLVSVTCNPLLRCILVAVPLTAEHIVTVEAGHDDPLGTAIEPIDRAIIGQDVKINFTCAKTPKT